MNELHFTSNHNEKDFRFFFSGECKTANDAEEQELAVGSTCSTRQKTLAR
jgi:hypothetical protein